MNPEAGRMWQFAKWSGGTCLGPIWQGAGEHLAITQDLADTWQKQCPRVCLGHQTGRGGCCKGPCPPGTVAVPTRCPGGSSTNNALTTAVRYFHLFPLHFNKMEKKPKSHFSSHQLTESFGFHHHCSLDGLLPFHTDPLSKLHCQGRYGIHTGNMRACCSSKQLRCRGPS